MKIYHQSVFESWPIKSDSAQSIITSPPYYALRKYSIEDVVIGGDTNCKHEFDLRDMELGHEKGFCIHCKTAWKGQYGLEESPSLYIEHTRMWAKEAWRVLRKDGVFFLNLADSYPSGGGKAVEQSAKRQSAIDTGAYPDYSPSAKLRQSMPKCQLLIPHKVAIALIEDGWVLRNTIIWHKPNAMPESVTDRFSKKYEYIFIFVKQRDYYFNLDTVREPHKEVSIERVKHKWNGHKEPMSSYANMDISKMCHPLGKNPGDAWTDFWSIPTQPSRVSHYSMWPEKLAERMVKCSTKAGDTVLDPFCGTATTLKVAEELQRVGIGIDLGYADISKKRTANVQRRMW